jgi:predicted  nucleic acid-binding Zn-ribbon protein
MKFSFSKIAALFLGGALLAVGCATEGDIHEVNERIDALIAGRVATAESQIVVLQGAVNDLKGADATINSNIEGLKGQIANLKTVDGQLDQAIKANAGEISNLKTAVNNANSEIQKLQQADEAFKAQIQGLTQEFNAAIQNLESKKADKTQVAEDIAAAEGRAAAALEQVRATLAGQISGLDGRLTTAENALSNLIEKTIPGINEQIEDLKNVKLDKSDFEAYKTATAETLRLLQEAATDLAEGLGNLEDKLDKEVEKINKNLEDNYLLKTTFNTYVQANDAEVKALKDNLSAVKDVLVEAYEIAGADNLTLAQTLKAAIDANNEKLAEVDQAIEDLKKADENLQNAIDAAVASITEITKEGGLIDQAKAEAIQKASDYAKGLVDELEKKLNAKIEAVTADVNKLLARVQSVVYVPDFDDNKITVNLAALYDASIVELEEEQEWGLKQAVAHADEANEAGYDLHFMFEGRPTKITYKVNPADAAADLVEAFKADPSVFNFHVKPVQTRADEAAAAPAFKILNVELPKADDGRGYVEFTVLPTNIDFAAFYYTDLKPEYLPHVALNDSYYKDAHSMEDFYQYAYNYFYEQNLEYLWLIELFYGLSEEEALEVVEEWTLMDLEDYGIEDDGTTVDTLEGSGLYWVLYTEEGVKGYLNDIWDFEAYLEKYHARAAYAAALEVKSDDKATDISSSYNILYPGSDILEMEFLEDPYTKNEETGEWELSYNEEGYGMYEQQYIEYNAPADTVKTILDKSEQVVRINGEVLNYQAAREKYGVAIPLVEKVEVPEDPEDAHYYSYDEPDYLTVDEKVYTDVTMNQDLSLAVRKTGIGEYYGQAYEYTTPFGTFIGKGYVDIVATQAALNVETTITWNWDDDAQVDHNLAFEEDGDNFYRRAAAEVKIVEDADYETFVRKIAGDTKPAIAAFAPVQLNKDIPVKVKMDGKAVENPEIQINEVNIDKDGKITAAISNFEFGHVYVVTGVFDVLVGPNDDTVSANVTVTFTINTVDRNRDEVVIALNPYEVVLNGKDFADGAYNIVDVFGKKTFDAAADAPAQGYVWEAKNFVEKAILTAAELKKVNAGEKVGYIYPAYDRATKEHNVAPLDSGVIKVVNNEGEVADAELVEVLATLTAQELKDVLGKEQKFELLNWLGDKVTVTWKIVLSADNFKYDYVYNRYFTKNAPREKAKLVGSDETFVEDVDFAEKVWWTQVTAWYNEEKTNLTSYDVYDVRLAYDAFDIYERPATGDARFDKIVNTDPEGSDLEKLNLRTKFNYWDVRKFGATEGVAPFYAAQAPYDNVALPKEDLGEKDGISFATHADLWKIYENSPYYKSSLYYRTREHFLSVRGELYILSDGVEFEMPTSFLSDKEIAAYNAAYCAPGKGFTRDEDTYDNFRVVRWTPFHKDAQGDVVIKLDNHEVYEANLFEGLHLVDYRDAWTSYDVIANGGFVVGDGKNGYAEGVTADQAYDIVPEFTYDTSNIGKDLQKLLTVIDNNKEVNPDGAAGEATEPGAFIAPTVRFDYTSQVDLIQEIVVPVYVVIPNKWQEPIEFSFNIRIQPKAVWMAEDGE